MRFLTALTKIIVGLLLLPFCVAATQTLVFLVRSIQPAAVGAVPRSAWGLLIGFVLWIVCFFATPRPVRTYVLAHELTHALWGWVMGARISRMKVSKRGGSVTLSKNNFLITLAPYFFPLYTVLVIILYYALSLFFDLHTYEPFWLGLVSLTWAFHLTFTITTLMEHQPDVRLNGRLFSYAVIYLFNVLGIGLWIVGVASPTIREFGGRLGSDILAAWTACGQAITPAWEVSRERLPAVFSNVWKK